LSTFCSTIGAAPEEIGWSDFKIRDGIWKIKGLVGMNGKAAGRLGSFPLGRKHAEMAAIVVGTRAGGVSPASNAPTSQERLQSGADISRGNSKRLTARFS
jgi:hypothetical protein